MNEPRHTLPPMQLASLKVAAWLLSLALSFSAAAASEAAKDPVRNDRPDAAGPAHRMDGLREELKLEPAQEALFKSAFDGTEKLRQEMRDTMREKHAQMKARLEAKDPDLHALVNDMDKEKAEHDAKRKVVRDAWLKFYDALKPEQKQIASKFLLAQIGMMGEGGPGMMQGHRGPSGKEAPSATPPGNQSRGSRD